MSNETFLAIAMAVVVSFLAGFVAYKLYALYRDAKEDGKAMDITLAEIMNVIGDISSRVYYMYSKLGGIKSSDYETDKDYRAEVISNTISIIIDICKAKGINVNLDQQLLESLACTVIERIINTYTIEDQQAKIAELNNILEKLTEPAVTNVTGDQQANEEVSVALGDFYK